MDATIQINPFLSFVLVLFMVLLVEVAEIVIKDAAKRWSAYRQRHQPASIQEQIDAAVAEAIERMNRAGSRT